MPRLLASLVLAGLAGCSAKWAPVDLDGDGFTVEQGDCDEGEGGDAVYPGAPETWYDGIDQDCSGGSDFDQDGDGFDGGPDGTDCWDDPTAVPTDFEALNGATQLEAAEVHPDADDAWYDGIDADCGGDSDFDQDGDGHDAEGWLRRDGSEGDDCYDAVDPDCVTYAADEPDCDYPVDYRIDESVGIYAPEEIHPDAGDTWYDGTDQDCGGEDDYDQDGDGYARYEECADQDPSRYPDDTVVEDWYDGVDQNCDGNDGDQDLDGYYAADYPFPELVPKDYLAYTGDCADDPADPALADDGSTVPAASINPGVPETWYDDVDEDCDGADDYDQDADGHTSDSEPNRAGRVGDDCDDTTDLIHPGALDTWYDGVDSDCAGNDDYDQDADGHTSDSEPDGSGHVGDDCDDTNDDAHPGLPELCSTAFDDDCDGSDNDPNATGCRTYYADGDSDGYYGSTTSQCLCEAEGVYRSTSYNDCNDAVNTVHPGATETCNDVDDDCDSSTDEGLTLYYDDTDRDGYGSTRNPDCASGVGRAANDDDCNDANADINPGEAERCNDVDDNCSGAADEGLATGYPDADSDGYGSSTGTLDCDDGTVDRVATRTDCNDGNADINPGEAERCNDIDDDCDSSTDEGLTTGYPDADGDGYGSTSGTLDCDDGTVDRVPTNTDCNDSNRNVNPGAAELCSTPTTDDDCDGGTNDVGATGCTTFYRDSDNDTYGTPTASQCTCVAADPYDATNSTDCNDSSSAVHPGATETCNTTDDDCDSSVDEGLTQYYLDGDGDGEGAGTGSCVSTGRVSTGTDCDDTSRYVKTGGAELCDGIKNNCSDTSWTDADEDGTVSTVSSTGTWNDVSSSWAGTESSPGSYTAPTSGTVWFCRGTYFGRITASASSTAGLSIRSRHGVDDTIIDAAGSGSVLTVPGTSNGTVTVQELTLTGGSGTSSSSNLYGGAVYSYASSAPSYPLFSLQGCVLTGNSADYGGGVALIQRARGEIDASTIDTNQADYGGGISVRETAQLTVTDTVISNNTATANGGGVYADTTTSRTSAQVTLDGVTVEDNVATANGGGIAADNVTWVDLMNSIVRRNDAVLGGGIWLDESYVNCTGTPDDGGADDGILGIWDNSASTQGGGVYLSRASSSSVVSFEAFDCDMGAGTKANNTGPSGTNDITVKLNGSSSYSTYGTYGADTTTACDISGCSP